MMFLLSLDSLTLAGFRELAGVVVDAADAVEQLVRDILEIGRDDIDFLARKIFAGRDA